MRVRSSARFVQLSTTITIDPDYTIGTVLSTVDEALHTQFGFDPRDWRDRWRSAKSPPSHRAVTGVVGVASAPVSSGSTAWAAEDRFGVLPGGSFSISADGTSLGAELLTLDPGPFGWRG